MSRYRLLFQLLFLLASANIYAVKAKTLRLAVASNFIEAAEELVRAYEKLTNQNIQISSGSSGKLYLQISHGAPFDIFLSADSQKPNELVKNGLAITDSQQTYAIGKLNLWLKNCVTAPAISILAEEKIRKIAIANPKLAPYGHASQKLLEKYQLWEKLTPKLIYSENIAQVAQLAKLGVIDAALIAESNAAKLTLNEKHCLVKLDTIDYPAISQQLVIMTNSQNKPAAREFALFLKSKKAQSLIKNMGYLTSNSARIAP